MILKDSMEDIDDRKYDDWEDKSNLQDSRDPDLLQTNNGKGKLEIKIENATKDIQDFGYGVNRGDNAVIEAISLTTKVESTRVEDTKDI
ncbi:hypothetical protein R1flu_004644 [Riccia fluitans]|uniref:Uncharacterized protein n=1 Tax=Riccia fluitans TaxID=41844 RepID=A0ABD1YR98_9MARC